MIEPTIAQLTSKTLIGVHTLTSVAAPTTPQMWSRFMPRKKEIQHQVGQEVYSLQVYPTETTFLNFDPKMIFTSWAAVEVSLIEGMPEDMEKLELPGGLYLTYIHKGAVDTFSDSFGYVLGEWLPKSPYELDDRIHFEKLGDKFLGPHHPLSEEEVWIPIRPTLT